MTGLRTRKGAHPTRPTRASDEQETHEPRTTDNLTPVPAGSAWDVKAACANPMKRSQRGSVAAAAPAHWR
ncbi:hypothetical protein JY651_49285 [Pyxidicoccus parkwayensis]|uniref:Uncharacterized protein n=1 Tax=Pyxidicoccus parkwayensis TaxID=2813578 RepID=A0ABX7P240_9BACT|nr:hypothetical protein [Pyxidicoccus parkwaysis]QSQ23003.1 hypothetical protein JY651_49285 [Pyxidicoccus parkwaysis]